MQNLLAKICQKSFRGIVNGRYGTRFNDFCEVKATFRLTLSFRDISNQLINLCAVNMPSFLLSQ